MNPTYADIATRLADEEVPLRAIARALRTPSDEVRDVLRDAVGNGRILRVPRDDWHPHPHGTLAPVAAVAKMEDEDIIRNCKRTFKVTGLQASILALLVRRNEVQKEVLHQRIQQRRKNNKTDETDPKMVDVVICNLRKRLKPFDLKIETLWGDGYYMTPETRARAQQQIADFLEINNGRPNTQRADAAGPSFEQGNAGNEQPASGRGDGIAD